jgi:hypothetical protein
VPRACSLAGFFFLDPESAYQRKVQTKLIVGYAAFKQFLRIKWSNKPMPHLRLSVAIENTVLRSYLPTWCAGCCFIATENGGL